MVFPTLYTLHLTLIIPTLIGSLLMAHGGHHQRHLAVVLLAIVADDAVLSWGEGCEGILYGVAHVLAVDGEGAVVCWCRV